MYDMRISGNHCSINCNCNRWDVSNYDITLETFLKKNDLKNLRDSVRPGATGELYNILGRPRYYDRSWKGYNTISISSNSRNVSKLRKMRPGRRLIFVKNLSDSPIPGKSGWISVKIEGCISGMRSI